VVLGYLTIDLYFQNKELKITLHVIKNPEMKTIEAAEELVELEEEPEPEEPEIELGDCEPELEEENFKIN
jgi:hypothetical protein